MRSREASLRKDNWILANVDCDGDASTVKRGVCGKSLEGVPGVDGGNMSREDIDIESSSLLMEERILGKACGGRGGITISIKERQYV